MEMLKRDAVSSSNNEIIYPNIFSKGRIDLELLLKVIKNLDSEDVNSIIFLMTNKDEDVPFIITILKKDCESKCLYIVNQRDWQEKLLECLVVIKNEDMIRLMGFTLPEIKEMKRRFSYNVHNVGVYINRVIKSLFFLCENLKLDEKNQLIAEVNKELNISTDFTDENIELELFILHWIQKEFITVNPASWNLDKLSKILKPIVSQDLSFNFIDFWKDRPKVEDRSTNNDHSRVLQANTFNKVNDSTAEASNGCNGYSLEQSNDVNNIENISSHWERKPKLCIIVNIINFNDKYPKRRGSEKDGIALITTFKKCGFAVEDYEDLTKDDMLLLLNTLPTSDYTKYGCIFMCILSHGTKDEVPIIIFNDAKTLTVEEIKDKFCIKELVNVFKFLILQSCQGKKMGLINAGLKTDGPSDDHNSAVKDCPLYHQHFGIFQSTIPNFVSMRHESEGTWFIQELCYVLKNHTPIKIFELVEKVNQNMSKKRGQHNCETEIVQLSCITEATISASFIIPKYEEKDEPVT